MGGFWRSVAAKHNLVCTKNVQELDKEYKIIVLRSMSKFDYRHWPVMAVNLALKVNLHSALSAI